MAKQLINYSPAFYPGTANTGFLDFTSMMPAFSLNQLYAVINVTRNTLLYAPGVPTAGLYTNPSNINTAVIYLASDTSSYAQTDKINIVYDAETGSQGPAGSNEQMERGGMAEATYILLSQMLLELKVQSYLLQQGLYPTTKDDLDQLRNDLLNQSVFEGTDNTGLG
jgi:hypothetical protein